MGGELIDLIGERLEEERLEEERLNAPNVTPSCTPPSPPAKNVAKAKTMPVEASKQQPTVEVDEITVTSNPPFAVEDPVSELNSGAVVVQPLINLEKEPVATDVRARGRC